MLNGGESTVAGLALQKLGAMAENRSLNLD